MLSYCAISSFFLLIGGIVWSKNGIKDLIVKIIFIVLSLWGIIVTLQLEGYIIKIKTPAQIEFKVSPSDFNVNGIKQ